MDGKNDSPASYDDPDDDGMDDGDDDNTNAGGHDLTQQSSNNNNSNNQLGPAGDGSTADRDDDDDDGDGDEYDDAEDESQAPSGRGGPVLPAVTVTSAGGGQHQLQTTSAEARDRRMASRSPGPGVRGGASPRPPTGAAAAAAAAAAGQDGDGGEGGDDGQDGASAKRQQGDATVKQEEDDEDEDGGGGGGGEGEPATEPRGDGAGQPQWKARISPWALNTKQYDIVPTMAAPMATSINAVSCTPNLRFWLTGGSDGYVRKYHGPDTINGKQLLTVAQRHPFVDSVTKAGVLVGYWENAEPAPSRGSVGGGGPIGANGRIAGGAGLVGGEAGDTPLSPVYSLAVHSQALWCLAGTEAGAINLFSVRHDEGKRIAFLPSAYHSPMAGSGIMGGLNPSGGLIPGHRSAVSVLTLTPDEHSVLSGGWDKRVLDWDLDTGSVRRAYEVYAGSGNVLGGGQLAAIELRPEAPASTVAFPRGEEEHHQWAAGADGAGGGAYGGVPPGGAGGTGWGQGYGGSDTFASTNGAPPRMLNGGGGELANGVHGSDGAVNGGGGGARAAFDPGAAIVGVDPLAGGAAAAAAAAAPGGGGGASPAHESLFGGSDTGSLFGEDNGGGDGEYDNDFAQALQDTSAGGAAAGGGQQPPPQQQQQHADGDVSMGGVDVSLSSSAVDPAAAAAAQLLEDPSAGGIMAGMAQVNGSMGAGSLGDSTTAAAAPPPPRLSPSPLARESTPLQATGGGPAAMEVDGDDGNNVAGDVVVTDAVQAGGSTVAGGREGGAGSPSGGGITVVVDPTEPTPLSSDVFLSASIDGSIRIWDRRAPNPVAAIATAGRCPPWCMAACWSPDGNWIYAGRRNGTVEEFSVHKARGASSATLSEGWTVVGPGGSGGAVQGRGMSGWQPTRILKFPGMSGPISAVRPMVNGRHLVCASHDILRLWDLQFEADAPAVVVPNSAQQQAAQRVPFSIVPGPPRPGVISTLYVDQTSRFMISAAGTRGWEGSCTECLIGYEIGVLQE